MSFSDLVGKKILNIESSFDEIIFHTDNGTFTMYHNQDCCENVSIEDIDGDLMDLLNQKILLAEKRTNDENPKPDEYNNDCFLWTFYTIRTVKSSVTIRWYGSSNGYYSVEVSFIKKNVVI